MIRIKIGGENDGIKKQECTENMDLCNNQLMTVLFIMSDEQ